MGGVASGRGRVVPPAGASLGWGWGGGWMPGVWGGLDGGRVKSAAVQWVWPEYLCIRQVRKRGQGWALSWATFRGSGEAGCLPNTPSLGRMQSEKGLRS